VPQPDHGVITVFITLPNTKIELLEPLGEASPIANSSSAIRTAASITSATRSTTSRRARQAEAKARACSATAMPKIGAHGKPVLFLHPKDFCGTLVEIEQA
jgi:methylmalonyl-CoA/ethylmalonyl-CoA epimerase